MKTLLSIFLALFIAGNVYGSNMTLPSGAVAPTAEVLDIEATDFATVGAVPNTVYSFSVPGGTLSTVNALQITLVGDMAGGTNATDVTFVYGATTIASFTEAPPNDPTNYTIIATLTADDATGAQDGSILMEAGDSVNDSGFGSATEDSTGALTISVTVDTNDAGQTYTMRHATLTKLSP